MPVFVRVSEWSLCLCVCPSLVRIWSCVKVESVLRARAVVVSVPTFASLVQGDMWNLNLGSAPIVQVRVWPCAAVAVVRRRDRKTEAAFVLKRGWMFTVPYCCS